MLEWQTIGDDMGSLLCYTCGRSIYIYFPFSNFRLQTAPLDGYRVVTRGSVATFPTLEAAKLYVEMTDWSQHA